MFFFHSLSIYMGIFYPSIFFLTLSCTHGCSRCWKKIKLNKELKGSILHIHTNIDTMKPASHDRFLKIWPPWNMNITWFITWTNNDTFLRELHKISINQKVWKSLHNASVHKIIPAVKWVCMSVAVWIKHGGKACC